MPPHLFGCGYAALWFAFSVPPPTPSHNLPQTFFPFLFNHLPSPPFFFSCSYLVC